MKKLMTICIVACFVLMCNLLVMASYKVTIPEITTQTENITAISGQPVVIIVNVSGNPEPSGSITFNDMQIGNNKDYQIKYENGRCILTIRNVNPSLEGKYTFTFKNNAGEVSVTINLRVVNHMENL